MNTCLDFLHDRTKLRLPQPLSSSGPQVQYRWLIRGRVASDLGMDVACLNAVESQLRSERTCGMQSVDGTGS